MDISILSGDQNQSGGTGQRFGKIVVILAGVAALSATLLTFVSTWLQTKNYRKPLLQRYVVRILLIVPIYSAASWASLTSLKVAFWIDPFRDVYEAFTIYAFFQLLINFLGGERSLIIMMHGRPPVKHPWPLSLCLPKMDISDPHTFLATKRGILQYTWVKPILSVATIIMKATGTYKEGVIQVTSGYFWTGLLYNITITVSLYALAMFWVCMSDDLHPFRPMPKFLCIKGIIFASYWQGFFLGILVAIKAIPNNVGGYTSDNLAAAIQDALICFEMPIFAILHWYAFSWHDYADQTISAARMPVKYALRDAFGGRDLVEDAKETFAGSKYDYRHYDAEDGVLAHEESAQRVARMKQGMRYERGGKGKYWIPDPRTVNHPDSKTPLLQSNHDDEGRSPSPSGSVRPSPRYGATSSDDVNLDPEDEKLYGVAKTTLEFGDWNYPVITAHHATRHDQLHADPDIITASTNRNLLHPTKDNARRRKSRIEDIQDSSNNKGKHRESSSSDDRSPSTHKDTRAKSRDSSSVDRSQLVDLVVEDDQAEEIERVRARKDGSSKWNRQDPKVYVRTYPDSDQEEEVREGYQPNSSEVYKHENHTDPSESKDNEEDEDDPQENNSNRHDSFTEERNVWDSPKR